MFVKCPLEKQDRSVHRDAEDDEGGEVHSRTRGGAVSGLFLGRLI
jgi:hypothetical protein